jgi:uncharacterized membrane protein YphA (DoxX/SURF4 family)
MKKMNWNCHRILFIFSRLILGGVFIYACFDKILHPAAFSKAVYNYQILPDVFINLTAIVLPWLELVLGVIFIIGIWMPGAVVMSNLLLTMFTGALLFNLARGLDISCGCFLPRPWKVRLTFGLYCSMGHFWPWLYISCI